MPHPWGGGFVFGCMETTPRAQCLNTPDRHFVALARPCGLLRAFVPGRKRKRGSARERAVQPRIRLLMASEGQGRINPEESATGDRAGRCLHSQSDEAARHWRRRADARCSKAESHGKPGADARENEKSTRDGCPSSLCANRNSAYPFISETGRENHRKTTAKPPQTG